RRASAWRRGPRKVIALSRRRTRLVVASSWRRTRLVAGRARRGSRRRPGSIVPPTIIFPCMHVRVIGRPVLVAGRRVAIRDAAAMLDIVIPVAVLRVTITVLGSIHPDVVVVDVDIDTVSAPVRTTPTPIVGGNRPRRTPENTSCNGTRIRRVAPDWRRIPEPRPIGWRPPCTVDHGRVVNRHVDILRLRRLDNDRLLLKH